MSAQYDIVDDRDGPCVIASGPTVRRHWKRKYGEIPHGLELCHRCDRGECRNLGHVWLGTQKDNVQDCIAKGRFSLPPREHINALTKEVADAIFVCVQESRTGVGKYGTLTYTQIGKLFCVSASTVKRIVHGYHYTGVTPK